MLTVVVCAGVPFAAAKAELPDVEALFVFGEAEGARPFASLFSSGPVPDVKIDPATQLLTLPSSVPSACG